MSLSQDCNPDTRVDVRAAPKDCKQSREAYMEHIENHSREWYSNSMHKQILDMVTTKIFVMIEDDYLPVPGTIPDLINLLVSSPGVAVTSASATHRCPAGHKMGVSPSESIVWDEEKIVRRTSCSPKLTGIHEVASTGLFCFAAKTEVYRENFEECSLKNRLMTYIGHDVVIMSSLTGNGFKILVDFDMWGSHMCLTRNGIYYYQRKDAVQDTYTWNDRDCKYDYKLGR